MGQFRETASRQPPVAHDERSRRRAGHGHGAITKGLSVLAAGAAALATVIGLMTPATASGLQVGFATSNSAHTSVVVGNCVENSGAGGAVFGNLSKNSGDDGIVIGNWVGNSHANSIVIGNGQWENPPQGSQTIGDGIELCNDPDWAGIRLESARDNQVVLGNAKNTYTLPGLSENENPGFDSASGQFVITDDNGELGTMTITDLIHALDLSGTGAESLQLGAGSEASGARSTAIGVNARALELETTALGHGADAVAPGATALGQGSKAVGPRATAVGQGAIASGPGSATLGSNALATGEDSLALGTDSRALHDDAVAIGAGAQTSRENQIMIGRGSASYTMPGLGEQNPAFDDATMRVVLTDGAGELDTMSIGDLIHALDLSGSGENSLQLGKLADASGANSTAIGNDAIAAGTGSTSLGQGAEAGGADSVALGRTARAVHENAIAIGAGVESARDNQVALGSESHTYTLAGIVSQASRDAQSFAGDDAFLIITSDQDGNLSARSFAELGLAEEPADETEIGSGNDMDGNDLVIVGNDNTGEGDGTVIVGSGNAHHGDNNVTVGSGNTVTGNDNSTLGNRNRIAGARNITQGSDNQIAGARNAIMGDGNDVDGTGNALIGFDNSVTGDDNALVGSRIRSTGNQQANLGSDIVNDGMGGTAIGHGSVVSAEHGTAVGHGAEAGAREATAIGHGASARHERSVAIGTGAQTTRSDQIMLGSRSSTISAPGLANAPMAWADSPTRTDEHAEAKAVVAVDAQGNLGHMMPEELFASFDRGLDRALPAISERFDAMDTRIEGLSRKIDNTREGVAMALAMAAPMVANGKRYAVTGQWGTFDGKHAMALSGAMRIGDYPVYVNGGLGVGLIHGNVGGKAGVTVAW